MLRASVLAASGWGFAITGHDTEMWALAGLPLDASPFKYVHLGSLAYIGADKAVMDPAHKDSPVGAIKGWLMGFAWKGAETFMQISVKNMYLVSRDLVKTKVFGRDVSDV